MENIHRLINEIEDYLKDNNHPRYNIYYEQIINYIRETRFKNRVFADETQHIDEVALQIIVDRMNEYRYSDYQSNGFSIRFGDPLCEEFMKKFSEYLNMLNKRAVEEYFRSDEYAETQRLRRNNIIWNRIMSVACILLCIILVAIVVAYIVM